MSLSRRMFLGGLAGAAALGVAPIVRMRTANANGFPRRLVVFFTPNGTIARDFFPTPGDDFALTPILEPLRQYKDKLLVLDGLDLESSYAGGGGPHQRALASLLTGYELIGQWAGGVSVDQHIAATVSKDRPFKSVELGVQVRFANTMSRMIYAAAGQPMPPQESPKLAFDAIFGQIAGQKDPLGVEKLRRQRKSLLDSVTSELAAIKRELGGQEREMLDTHLDAVRMMEKELTASGDPGGACKPPEINAVGVDPLSPQSYGDVGKQQLDIIHMALACDLTRVASLQWSHGESPVSFPWIGVNSGHHGLSHSGDTNVAGNTSLTKIMTWYAEQLAYFVGKLAATPEGNGSLLDNTVVMWCNDLGKGNNHSRRRVPFLLIGNAGGNLRTGRAIDFGGKPHNQLLASLCQVMGLEDTKTFGNPLFCPAPLTGLG
ncbi:MAG: DUF1552 domain-containing protein [Myxococcales bacterium]|nr:DUF1552 domain-containing protein [Myxococcales bacterium]